MKRLFILLVAGAMMLPATAFTADEICSVVDQQPEYPAGVKELYHFISTQLQVPSEVTEKGFRGKTITRFVVNKNGELSDFEVLRSCGDSILDAEALRVLRTMPVWKPGMLGNEAVNAYFTLPVIYNIQPSPKDTIQAALKDSVPPTTNRDVQQPEEPVRKEKNAHSEKLFVVVDQMPAFPGGQQALFRFLSENVKYPKTAYENRIQGRVIVQFVVDKDGSITEVEVLQSGGDPSLDREAVRVVKSMPKWTPGKQEGAPVRVRYTMPVNFRLTSNKK